MLYIVIALLVVALAVVAWLAMALSQQKKLRTKQEDAHKTLLEDYQRRVDEQQGLLDDYRELEKNYENVGKGYEQTLLMFDQMEEEKQKILAEKENLEAQNHKYQEESRRSTDAPQKTACLEKLTTEIRTALKQMDTPDAQRVDGLVAKVQDINELSAKTAITPTDRLMVGTLIQQAIAESGIEKVNHVKFDTQVAAGIDMSVIKTNQKKAAHALSMLLDNAQKFTTEGTVTLRVDKTDSLFVFVVEDTGFGIPAEDAERAFEEFVQLNSYFDGLGIGLSVARSIARRLGGDVVVDTNYTEGARLVMTLPNNVGADTTLSC